MKNFIILACIVAASYAAYRKIYVPGEGRTLAQGAAPGADGQLPVLKMSSEATEGLAQLTPSSVVLFSAAWCPHCKSVRALLQRQGVRFTEFDVERNEQAAAFQREKLPVVGFPVTVIGNKIVMGDDEGQLLAALKSL